MNVVLPMLKFNLKWYGRVMRDILFRYKILLLFVVLLICPTLASLCHLLILPLKSLFIYPVTDVISFSASLFFYQIFGVIWISIQFISLFKPPWHKYLLTLELTNIQKQLIDISLLLFVDIVMWIPLLLATIKSITMLVITKCIVFIALTLLAQISLIKSKYSMWAAILLLDLFIIFTVITFSQLSQFILMIVLISVIYLLLGRCYENPSRQSLTEKKQSGVFASRINYHQSFPMLRIQIKNLFAYSSQLTILFSLMLVISLIAIVLMIFGITNPFLPFLISIAMLINSLSVSNIFNRVHTQWQEYSSYLSALPVSQFSLFKNILFIATGITILFNILIIFVADFLRGNDFVAKIMIAFFLAIVFLATTYLPQIKFRRLGFFVSFCLMFLFLYVDYLLI